MTTCFFLKLGGTCFRTSQTSLLALSFLAFAAGQASAQTGNDNLTGPSGIFNGNVTTGGNYDPFTSNAVRQVVDIAVANSAGTQPLAVVRTANSRRPSAYPSGDGYSFGAAGGWSRNYQWSLAISGNSTTRNFTPASYNVSFPDGRDEFFSASGTDVYFRAGAGVHERFIPMNPAGGNLRSYLLLADGSKIEFTATQQTVASNPPFYYYTAIATAAIDPYGSRTTLTYNANGLLVKEPAGRTLQFYNVTTAWGDKVIDHVIASDGRKVQYTYKHAAMTGAVVAYTYLDSVTYYNDSTLVARYTYQKPNIPDGSGTYNGYPLLRTCVDPMFSERMWMIAYRYQSSANADGSAAVYGQLLSENYYDGTTDNGTAVSTLKVDNTNNKRTETRGDATSAIRTFTYGGTYAGVTYPNYLLTSATDFKSIVAIQGYDGNSYVNSVKDRNGHITGFTLNPLTGAPVFVQFPATPTDGQPVGGSISYTYGHPVARMSIIRIRIIRIMSAR